MSSYLRPANVQNNNFKLGDVGSMVTLNQGPEPQDNVESSMQDLYALVNTNNLSGTAPLVSTTNNLTIQWFFGRDVNGNTNYRPYYRSGAGQSLPLTLNQWIYIQGNRAPWGFINGNTTRDQQGFLLGWDKSTGVKYWGAGCVTEGWRPGAVVYRDPGDGSELRAILGNQALNGEIPALGASGAAWSPVIDVNSGYGMTFWGDDNNFGRPYVMMWAWSSNSITPINTNVTYISGPNISGIGNEANISPVDSLYLGNQVEGYDVVAIAWQKQWWGDRITFVKRNGNTISSTHTQQMHALYEEYIYHPPDGNNGAMAWDPINNKIYLFFLYWADNGPYNSAALWSKCDVNLNGTGTVQTSNLTTWRMFDAYTTPGMRSAGLSLLYNDGTYNYLAVAWNRIISSTWYVYMRIYRNNPSTNTYTQMGSTYTLFSGTLFNNGGERIRVEKFADTVIVDSNGNPIQTLINFSVSYNEGSGGQVVVKNYTMDPSTYSVTLKNTTTMAGNFRGMLGHNYSDLTGEWFNSTILTAGINNGNGEMYPWNSKPYATQAQTDTTRIYKIG